MSSGRVFLGINHPVEREEDLGKHMNVNGGRTEGVDTKNGCRGLREK